MRIFILLRKEVGRYHEYNIDMVAGKDSKVSRCLNRIKE